MLKTKYTVTGPIHPIIFRAPISGKLYICPDWIEVPEGTTLKDVKWIKPVYNKPELVKKFKSSKGDIYYNVYKTGKDYSCDCPGFKYRNRLCKHIKQVIE